MAYLEYLSWCNGCSGRPSDAAEAAVQQNDAINVMETLCNKDTGQEDASVLFRLD